jgi:hypothetical protein
VKKKDVFEEWLKTKPKSIQKLAGKYHDEKYRIKDGAPYGVSCPGTIVHVYSYSEDGDIGVIVKAENKLPEAIQFEKDLCAKHGKATFHDKDVFVYVNPKWLEPLN